MGGVQIEGCPKAQVPGEIIELIEVAHDAKKRIFPVAGGTYDQAAGLMPAIRHIWRETAEYEQPNASTD